MSKRSPRSVVRAPAKRGAGYARLIGAIAAVNTRMVGRVATVANQALVLRNWMIGAYLVEYEQRGADRAKYGARLLEKLAEDLARRGARGLDVRTLRDCRKLVQLYPQIRGTVSPEFKVPSMGERVSVQLAGPADSTGTVCRIPETVSLELVEPKKIRGAVTPELPTPLTADEVLRFSWSQLQELLRLDDPWKRAFYENECLRGHWSVRQLQRQIETLLYERTGLSTNKRAVVERARKQEPAQNIAEMLRDPYILEFAGLAEQPEYSEDDLETALLDHLQRFLLELGRGFCFEARQFRITEGRKHHRIDLVFYHRVLRSHVLLDLKVRGFRPADAGQMNFYVNWFKAHMMSPGDQPPIGILLCSEHDGAEVEFATAGMDQKFFVSRYLTALPSAAQLKALLEQDRAEFRAQVRSKAKTR